jgi:hypothetical protein
MEAQAKPSDSDTKNSDEILVSVDLDQCLPKAVLARIAVVFTIV